MTDSVARCTVELPSPCTKSSVKAPTSGHIDAKLQGGRERKKGKSEPGTKILYGRERERVRETRQDKKPRGEAMILPA